MSNISHFVILFGMKEKIACFELCVTPVLIGGGAIFLVGSSSGETKIAEGIRDAKNHRFVLYIAFTGKTEGRGATAPQPPPMVRTQNPDI